MGPGSEPFTIDLDSTICETYGLRKEGGSDCTYIHTRGYHPLLAVAAGTGDVLMARLRGGSANTVHGAGSLLLPARWPWAISFVAALARLRAIPLLA